MNSWRQILIGPAFHTMFSFCCSNVLIQNTKKTNSMSVLCYLMNCSLCGKSIFICKLCIQQFYCNSTNITSHLFVHAGNKSIWKYDSFKHDLFLKVGRRNGSVRGDGQRECVVRMSDILEKCPYLMFIGIEIERDVVIEFLKSTNLFVHDSISGYEKLNSPWESNPSKEQQQDIYSTLIRFNCWCIICEEQYDVFPDYDMFAAHMTAAHIRI